MRPSGKVNLVGVAILAAIVYGVWWGVTYGPSRLDQFDVKEFVTAAANQAKTDNLANVRGVLISKLNGRDMGWHWEVDETGHREKKPGLGIKDEQIVVEINDVTNLITVSVEYDREIELKPFDKVEIKHFYFSKSIPYR